MGGHPADALVGGAPAARMGAAFAGEAARGAGACGRGAEATLAATLTDASGATASVSYDATASTLQVRVTGAEANASLDVTVDGTSVGTITTNDAGAGSLHASDVTASAGSTVTVGDLEGTLAQVRFAASLTGDTDATGSASFNASRSQLKLRVTGAAASTTYDVMIDGTTVGQLTTNASGAGKLSLTLSDVTIAAGTVVTVADSSGTVILTGTFA